ncbi:MAG: hypothetical protein J6Q94_01645 [Clostridia bacterium]|nr:hypothetical protein [Clostridia bacterium]
MKKLVSVIIAVLMLVSVCPMTAFAAEFNKGDINGDGVLSSRDVYEFRFGNDGNNNFDVNGDGREDENDKMLFSYLAVSKDDRYSEVSAPRVYDSDAELNGNIDRELEAKFSFKHDLSGNIYSITSAATDLDGYRIENYMHIIKFDPAQLTFKLSYDIPLTDMESYSLIEDGMLLCINVPGGYSFDCEYVRYDFVINDGVKPEDVKAPAIFFVEINDGMVSSLCNHTGGTATCTSKAVCEACGESYGDTAPHTGGTATCDRKAVCEICSQEYGKTAPHRETDFDDVCDTCGMIFDVAKEGIQLTAMRMDDKLYVFTTANMSAEFNYIFVQYSYNKNDIKLVVDDNVESGYVQLDLGEQLDAITEDGVYIIDQKVFTILEDDFELPEIIRAYAHIGEDENTQAVEFNIMETLCVDANHKHVDANSDSVCDLCAKISEDALNHDHVDSDFSCSCDICGYPVYYWGDMNMDGKVTAADARMALRISAKLDEMTEYALLVGDINRDGKLTAADARKILRISAKLE